ncbi:hypothetical protein [Liquorilactobacillus mali]|uniref:hypothetical protein n=1 Tax=Liquorilactobacillus mali TaxID=1618 RepID=UPI000249226D|nr:hypothetical protein [Liquorilactobacillus mali]
MRKAKIILLTAALIFLGILICWGATNKTSKKNQIRDTVRIHKRRNEHKRNKEQELQDVLKKIKFGELWSIRMANHIKLRAYRWDMQIMRKESRIQVQRSTC